MAEQKQPRGGLGGLKDLLDSNFGKPTEAIHLLTELSNAVASIDQAKLREVKGMLGSMSNVQLDVDQLRLVVELVRMFCTLDIEKVKEARQLVANIFQLVKALPKDLPVGEIVGTLKELNKG
jgi:hypothetical protein